MFSTYRSAKAYQEHLLRTAQPGQVGQMVGGWKRKLSLIWSAKRPSRVWQEVGSKAFGSMDKPTSFESTANLIEKMP